MSIPLPPNKLDLRAGQKLVAGNRESTIIADLDFETYSPAGYFWDAERNRWTGKGLIDVGAAKYSEHPDAEVLSMAYDLKDGNGIRHWTIDTHIGFLNEFFKHIDNGGLIESWNVSFERWIWNNVCVKKYGFPTIEMHQWRCAAAKARAHALPGSLTNAGEALKLTKQKDPRGKKLIQMFCVPRNPTKLDARLRLHPNDHTEGKDLYEYNIRDVEVESELSGLIPDLIPCELEFWQCDQEINYRGVQIDIESIHKCIAIIEQAEIKYNKQLAIITGGEVTSATEVGKLTKWCQNQSPDLIINSLDKISIEELLSHSWAPEIIKQALHIRQKLGSAAVKKLYAMRDQVAANGRLHDLFIYHSARTGRAAGQGPQSQNLPNSGPEVLECYHCKKYFKAKDSICSWCGNSLWDDYKYFMSKKEWCAEAAEDALEIINVGDLNTVEYYFEDAIATVSGCLRSLFIAKPGHDLICSDYSSIEAVVLAALAGEEWRLEVFRTHGKIYEYSASKITGIPFEEFELHEATTGTKHPKRKLGKTAELASGYGGWINSWKRFGADEFMSDDEIVKAADAWRKASPAIVNMWHLVEACAIAAVTNKGLETGFRGIKFQVVNNVLYIKLLSGRYLTYHEPKLEWDHQRNKFQLTFMGWNSNIAYGAIGWVHMRTYGARLTENIVQATARDILAHAIIILEYSGYPIVLHIHDEIVCEVPERFGSIEQLEQLMNALPEYALNWPIKAKGGWRGKRYRK